MGLKEDINDMKKEVKTVKELNKQSLAKEMLEDYKRQNKRKDYIIALLIVLLFATGCYLVYILNDTRTIETTTEEITQDNENGYNNYIGNDGEINNGKAENQKNQN